MLPIRSTVQFKKDLKKAKNRGATCNYYSVFLFSWQK